MAESAPECPDLACQTPKTCQIQSDLRLIWAGNGRKRPEPPESTTLGASSSSFSVPSTMGYARPATMEKSYWGGGMRGAFKLIIRPSFAEQEGR